MGPNELSSKATFEVLVRRALTVCNLLKKSWKLVLAGGVELQCTAGKVRFVLDLKL